MEPRRAIETLPSDAGAPRSRWSRGRVAVAGAAVASVAVLAAGAAFGPVERDAVESTEPSATAPAVSPSERSTPVSRANARPSVTPSASPTSASPSSTPTTPAPSPSPEPSSAAPATPTLPEVPAQGKVVGEQWATAAVNVRSGPGTAFGVLDTLAPGSEVSITEVVVDDRWQQISLGGEQGFVSAQYLSDEEPTTEPIETESEGGVSTKSCSAASGIESGLTDRTVRALRAICNEFPNVSSYGGYRNDGGSYHSSGRAIDVMISGEAGWEVARWAREHSSELGIIEVIYAQKIWTTQRGGEGWRSMSDRGSVSANHYDHVHVSVR